MNKFLFIILAFINTSFAQKQIVISQIAGTPDQSVGAKIIAKAYEKINVPIRFLENSGKRSLIESSRGAIDGEVHRIFEVGEAYPTLLKVPTHINYLEQNIFTIKDYDIRSCADLLGLSVGFVRGVKHAEMCSKNVKKKKEFLNSLDLIKALNERKVDVIITGYFNGLIQIKKLGYVKIKPLRPPLSRKKLYHYVHEKKKYLIPLLDKALKEMKRSGELEAIREAEMKRLEEEASNF